MPNMYIFICATWNNKECKIVRNDRVTRQHLIITTMIKFPQENMATCLPGGCCWFELESQSAYFPVSQLVIHSGLTDWLLLFV